MSSNSSRSIGERAFEHGQLARNWVGPVEFVACSPEQAAEHLMEIALEERGRHVHLANAYNIALADKRLDYRQLLSESGLVFPDGKPIGWVSRLRRQSPRLRQVRGPGLFLDVFDRGRSRGIRHYLLGSTPEVLEALAGNLQSRFPGVSIVGSESPPFRPLSPDELNLQDSRIRNSGAHIVWVGLGTPKQDFEAWRLANQLPVMAIAIGAAFDFTAGSVHEAPKWVSRIGLEWAYRLACEPRRLWKRYVFGNTRFLVAALVRTYEHTRTSPRTRDDA